MGYLSSAPRAADYRSYCGYLLGQPRPSAYALSLSRSDSANTTRAFLVERDPISE